MESEGSLSCHKRPPLVPIRSKEPIQVRGPMEHLVMSYPLRWRIVSPSPNIQTGGPPLTGCPWLLFQYIRSYPPP